MTDDTGRGLSPAGVVALRESQVAEASSMMARAFFDYPMWQWVLPDQPHRRAALPVAATSSVLWGLILGESYALGDPIRGVAIWAPPGMSDADVDPDGSRTSWSEAEAAIGAAGMRRLGAMIEIQQPLRERLIPAGGWYLPWLGVEPAAQRGGVGATLLRDMFARLDPQGVATFLETEKETNVPYYRQHGYEVVHEGMLPDGGPNFWCLSRRPSF